jgi:hypothetical protein
VALLNPTCSLCRLVTEKNVQLLLCKKCKMDPLPNATGPNAYLTCLPVSRKNLFNIIVLPDTVRVFIIF